MKLKSVVLGFFLLGALASCFKEVDLKGGAIVVQPVVSSFFNPDSIWRVHVSLSRATADTGVTLVSNATVTISGEDGFKEQLVFSHNGYYLSAQQSRPLESVQYSLEVKVPGFDVLTATDKIPAALHTGKVQFDTNQVSLTPNMFSEGVKTYPVTLWISDEDTAQKFYLLRPLYYEKDELKIYRITQGTLDSLSRQRLFFTGTDSVTFRTLIQQDFHGLTAFKKALEQQFRGRGFTISIYKYAYHATFDQRYSHQFYHQRAYVNDVYFRHLADDYYSVFGEKGRGKIIKDHALGLYYNALAGESFTIVNGQLIGKEVEWYLQVNTLSKAAYRYYTTYLQNIANRGNPFAEHINVFSNVTNGYGVFAGMQTERLKVF